MQAKKKEKFSFVQRVEKLKAANSWTWAELARQIGLSRAMLHLVRQGKYEASADVLHSLTLREIDAGIAFYTPEEVDYMVSAIRDWLFGKLQGLGKKEAAMFLASVLGVVAEELSELANDLPLDDV